jgi:hypothetical protein
VIRWAGHVADAGYMQNILYLVEKFGRTTHLGWTRRYMKNNVKTDKRVGIDGRTILTF